MMSPELQAHTPQAQKPQSKPQGILAAGWKAQGLDSGQAIILTYPVTKARHTLSEPQFPHLSDM